MQSDITIISDKDTAGFHGKCYYTHYNENSCCLQILFVNDELITDIIIQMISQLN
jgi:hypothetical protein